MKDAKATAGALVVLFDGAVAGTEMDGPQRASDARWMARKLSAAGTRAAPTSMFRRNGLSSGDFRPHDQVNVTVDALATLASLPFQLVEQHEQVDHVVVHGVSLDGRKRCGAVRLRVVRTRRALSNDAGPSYR
ncbi:MAG: hypothetical protein ABI603_03520 [Acidobacteriota bacterium]